MLKTKAGLGRRRQVTRSGKFGMYFVFELRIFIIIISYYFHHLFTDGKKLAYAWGVKFVETSVGLVYKTDELLVGIARQAGLNKKRNKLLAKKQKKMSSYLNNIKQFKWFSKVSCENLLVL